jgi:branched-chain amino acid aminotransferase
LTWFQQIAERKLGWIVEKREVPWSEVVSGAFNECGACGTAVVVTPVSEIHRDLGDGKMEVAKIGMELGGLQALFNAVREIQNGESDEGKTWGWMWPAEGI